MKGLGRRGPLVSRSTPDSSPFPWGKDFRVTGNSFPVYKRRAGKGYFLRLSTRRTALATPSALRPASSMSCQAVALLK